MPIVFPTYEKLSRLPVSQSRLDKWLDYANDRFDDLLHTRPAGYDPRTFTVPTAPYPQHPAPNGMMPGAYPLNGVRGPQGPYPSNGMQGPQRPYPPPSQAPRYGTMPSHRPSSSYPPNTAQAAHAPLPQDPRYLSPNGQLPPGGQSRDRYSQGPMRPAYADRRASAPAPAYEQFQYPPNGAAVPPPPKSILKNQHRPSGLNPMARPTAAVTPSPSQGSVDSPELKPADIQRVHPTNLGLSPPLTNSSAASPHIPSASSPPGPGSKTADASRSAGGAPPLNSASAPSSRRPNPYMPTGITRPDSYGTPRVSDLNGQRPQDLPMRPRASTTAGVPAVPVPIPQMSRIDPLFDTRRPLPPPQLPTALRHDSSATEEERWRARREAKIAASAANTGPDPRNMGYNRRPSVRFDRPGTATSMNAVRPADPIRDMLREERDRRDRRKDERRRDHDRRRRSRARDESRSSGSDSESEWDSRSDGSRSPMRDRRRRMSAGRR